MSSWLRAHSYSHETALIGTAIAGALAATTTIYFIQAVRRQDALKDLKASIPALTDGTRSEEVSLRRKKAVGVEIVPG